LAKHKLPARTKICHSTTSSTINPSSTILGMNLDLKSEKVIWYNQLKDSFDTQLPRLSATLYKQSTISYKKSIFKVCRLTKDQGCAEVWGQVTVSTTETGNERSINCCLSETMLSHNFSCALLSQYM